jgi:glycosyltransferase involved in cell wall biosynthesis
VSAQDSFKILALTWHSPQSDITAGGFLRAFEIFRRAPAGVEILLLDNSPSFLSGRSLPSVTVREYVIPDMLRRLEERAFALERVLEWILSFLLMTIYCVRLRLRSVRFDLVLAPSAEQIPALAAAVIAKHLFKTRLVGCNMNIEIFPKFLRRPIAWLHNSCDTVITLSMDLERRLRHYGVCAPIELNGAGLDLEKISTLPIEKPEDKRCDAIFVGRHDRQKGIFDLVRAWKEVTEQRSGARLAMVGSCNPVNRRRLEKLICELGIQENVDILGVVSDEEKFMLIHSSKICLFPSYVEGWAIVPQECLACGLPVVLYDLDVYAENIGPCGAVIKVPVGDWRAMADRALELLDGDEYRRYSDVGPECVSEFGWGQVATAEYRVLLRDRPSRVATRTGPAKRMTFSIVMPALNEARNIGALIEDIVNQRLPVSLQLEKVVVVSDCSTDDTEDIVRAYATEYDAIELIVNPETMGQAECINIGKRFVTSDFLVLLDGDIRLNGPETFSRLLSDVPEGVSMLGGNPVPADTKRCIAATASRCGDYMRNSLKMRLKGGNSIYSAHGRILALGRDLYSTAEVPVTEGGQLLAADQHFYLSCMDGDGRFLLRNDAEVVFQLPTSLWDYLKQSTRFMFSVSTMKDYLQEEMLEAEFDVSLRVKAASFMDVYVHHPIAVAVWILFRAVGRAWYLYKRYVLNEGVGAVWKVSESTKGGIGIS